MRTSAGFLTLLLFASLAIAMESRSVLADVTAAERRLVKTLISETSAAGKLFARGELDNSAEAVKAIQSKLITLLTANQDPKLQRLAKPIYGRLAKAHSLLELEDMELDALPSWEELLKPPATSGVSFKDDIAPWLVARCGNCHINRQRGEFSIATFAALRRGTPAGVVIFPGAAQSSRLVEVLESGDMPRGGDQLSTDQITQLRQWIDAGAIYDGPDANAPLRDLVVATPAGDGPMLSVGRPDGSETVSFTKDVAPILLDNCNGCHIDGRRASGNLRMDNFASLLRGGDSGALLSPGKPTESLLIKKLRGQSGQRMPAGGRPALAEAEIKLISTWIAEGARFDGSAPTASLAADSQLAWANSASHEELFQKRRQEALAQWAKLSPNDTPLTASNKDLLVLGNVPQPRIDAILERFTAASQATQKLLKLPPDQSLIKGGMAIFVLKNRYNYGEFGRMIQGHELPKDWQAHWNTNGIEVYGVVLANNDWTEETAAPHAMHVMTGSFLGSHAGVPYWFAEGTARNLVSSANRRSDLTTQWTAQQPNAIQRLKTSKQLAGGKLDEQTAGLVGMGVSKVMMNRNNRRRFDKLLQQLQTGVAFDTAMANSYAPTETFLKSVIGR